MITGTLIASVADETIHCEWYQEDFEGHSLREKLKTFLREKPFLANNFEVVNMKDDLCLQSPEQLPPREVAHLPCGLQRGFPEEARQGLPERRAR